MHPKTPLQTDIQRKIAMPVYVALLQEEYMEVMIVEICMQQEVLEVLPKERQRITKDTVLIKVTVDRKVICQLLVDLVHIVILQNLHLLRNLK